MSFQIEKEQGPTLKERIAPFFYENIYDKTQTAIDDKNFNELHHLFEIGPDIEKMVSENCLDILLNESRITKIEQEEICYFLFKYHTTHVFSYENGSDFDQKELCLIHNVMNTYQFSDFTLSMLELENDFLDKKDFNPNIYDKKRMDLYRIETMSNVAIDHALFESKMRAEAYESSLNMLVKLGDSENPFIQKRLTDMRNELLDSLSEKPNAPTPKL